MASILHLATFLAMMVGVDSYYLHSTFTPHDKTIKNPDRGFYEILWVIVDPYGSHPQNYTCRGTTVLGCYTGDTVYYSIEEFERLRHISSLGGKTLVAIYFDLKALEDTSTVTGTVEETQFIKRRIRHVLGLAWMFGLKVIMRIVSGNIGDHNLDVTGTPLIQNTWLNTAVQDVLKPYYYTIFNMEFGIGENHGEGDMIYGYDLSDTKEWYQTNSDPSSTLGDPYYPESTFKCLKAATRSLTTFMRLHKEVLYDNAPDFDLSTNLDQIYYGYQFYQYSNYGHGYYNSSGHDQCGPSARLQLFDDCWLDQVAATGNSPAGHDQDTTWSSFWDSPGFDWFLAGGNWPYWDAVVTSSSPTWANFSTLFDKKDADQRKGRWTGTMGGRFCRGTSGFNDTMGGLTCQHLQARAQFFEMTYFKYEQEYEDWPAESVDQVNQTFRNERVISSLEDLSQLPCFDNFKNKLGYRYTLINATLFTNRTTSDASIHPGHAFGVNITLRNDGYAHKIYKSNLKVKLISNLLPSCAVWNWGVDTSITGNTYPGTQYAHDCQQKAADDGSSHWRWKMPTLECLSFNTTINLSSKVNGATVYSWDPTPYQAEFGSAIGYAYCEVSPIEVDGNIDDWTLTSSIALGNLPPALDMSLKFTNDNQWGYVLIRGKCTATESVNAGSCSDDELYHFLRASDRGLGFDTDYDTGTGDADGFDMWIRDDDTKAHRRGSSLQMGNTSDTKFEVPNTGLIVEFWNSTLSQWVRGVEHIQWVPSRDPSDSMYAYDEIAFPIEHVTHHSGAVNASVVVKSGDVDFLSFPPSTLQIHWTSHLWQFVAEEAKLTDTMWYKDADRWDTHTSDRFGAWGSLGSSRSPQHNDVRYLIPGQDFHMSATFIMPFLPSFDYSVVKWSIVLAIEDDVDNVPLGWGLNFNDKNSFPDGFEGRWTALRNHHGRVRIASNDETGRDIWDPVGRYNILFPEVLVTPLHDSCSAVNNSPVGHISADPMGALTACPWLQNLIDDGVCIFDSTCSITHCPGLDSNTLYTSCNPSCLDGVQNGDETYTDGGGSCDIPEP